MKQYKKAAFVAAIAAMALTPATVMAGGQKTPKQPPKSSCGGKNQPKCPEVVRRGRMTGHGHIDNHPTYGKVQWEFRNSVCGAERFPDLKVEFGGHRFILTDYAPALVCLDLPGISEGQPRAGFDTIDGQGPGTLDGVAGANADFQFTDAGEPGRNDLATITITDPDGDVVLQLTNVKAGAGGNHQAHRR